MQVQSQTTGSIRLYHTCSIQAQTATAKTAAEVGKLLARKEIALKAAKEAASKAIEKAEREAQQEEQKQQPPRLPPHGETMSRTVAWGYVDEEPLPTTRRFAATDGGRERVRFGAIPTVFGWLLSLCLSDSFKGMS